MKRYKQFLLLLAMLPVGTFAKDNFKMTGKIDGVGNDTLCIDIVEAHWSDSTFYQQYEQVKNLQRPFNVENQSFRHPIGTT